MHSTIFNPSRTKDIKLKICIKNVWSWLILTWNSKQMTPSACQVSDQHPSQSPTHQVWGRNLCIACWQTGSLIALPVLVGTPAIDLASSYKKGLGERECVSLALVWSSHSGFSGLLVWNNTNINNGNRTEWSPIWSVIIWVITKLNDCEAGVRFVNHVWLQTDIGRDKSH